MRKCRARWMNHVPLLVIATPRSTFKLEAGVIGSSPGTEHMIVIPLAVSGIHYTMAGIKPMLYGGISRN